jgi:hypothetical protein
MEIPDFVVDRATFFAIRYSNMNDEEEIRDYIETLLIQKVLGIQCFGGEVIWKE